MSIGHLFRKPEYQFAVPWENGQLKCVLCEETQRMDEWILHGT